MTTMNQIHIPSTIDEAKKRLDEIERALRGVRPSDPTYSRLNWERAAIVYAFTTDKEGAGK